MILVSSNGSQDKVEVIRTAGSALGGHRVVKSIAHDRVDYASASSGIDCHSVLGVTLGAANLDTKIVILTLGSVVEPSWNWIAHNPIYLGENGLLTQSIPTTGHILVIGFATSVNSMDIKIGHPVALS